MAQAASAEALRQISRDETATTVVAAKAFVRVAEAWKLRNEEAAGLMDISGRTWNRMKAGNWTGRLARDQLLRASGIVGLYKALHLYFSDPLADEWVKLSNSGPAFANRRPLDVMISTGLPGILGTRDYVDALRGGV